MCVISNGFDVDMCDFRGLRWREGPREAGEGRERGETTIISKLINKTRQVLPLCHGDIDTLLPAPVA